MRRGTGWDLTLLLVAVPLVARLAISNMDALRPSTSTEVGTEQAADPVEQAQDAVDALNEMQEQSAGQIEE